MRVERHGTAPAFLEAAGDFLVRARGRAQPDLRDLRDLGRRSRVLQRALSRDGLDGGPRRRGRDHDAALEPGPVVHGRARRRSAALAADLDARGIAIPGMTGPVEIARRLRRRPGAGRTASPAVSRIAERVYRLERVVPPAGVAGHGPHRDRGGSRPADRLGRRVPASRRSTEPTPSEAAAMVDRSFRTGTRTWYLWEDGEPGVGRRRGRPDPERDPHRPGLHAARPAPAWLRERADRRRQPGGARQGTALRLPLHRPRRTRPRTRSTSRSATSR